MNIKVFTISNSLLFLLLSTTGKAAEDVQQQVETTSDELARSESRCGWHPSPSDSAVNRNIPSVTFSTNCDFFDHALYTWTCIADAFTCASLCAADRLCSHFTYIGLLNGGTCRLKSAFHSGGSWALSIAAPSPYVCGYIPSRALGDIFLNICVGTDITGVARRR